jgi:hypothetical protein
MADEKDPFSGIDRPVEPPVIDLEAEEVDKTNESTEQPAADTSADGRSRAWVRNLPLAAVILGAAIILAGAVIWAVLSFADFRGSGPDQTLASRLNALEAASEQIQVRMSELTAAIGELKDQPTPPAAVDPMEQAAVEQQLQLLQNRIGALDRTIEQIGASLKTIESGQNAQQGDIKTATSLIGELQSRLSTERQPVAADKASGNELAATTMKLKAAVEEGRPFAAELDALGAMIPDAAAVAELRPVSVSGLVKAADLEDKLRTIVEDLRTPAAAQAAAGQPSGLWDAFKSKAKSLISVRKLEDARWLDAAAGALERLKQGDLTGAVQILNSVEGKPPSAVEAWLKDAAARLQAEEAIEELSAGVLKQLGSGS